MFGQCSLGRDPAHRRTYVVITDRPAIRSRSTRYATQHIALCCTRVGRRERTPNIAVPVVDQRLVDIGGQLITDRPTI